MKQNPIESNTIDVEYPVTLGCKILVWDNGAPVMAGQLKVGRTYSVDPETGHTIEYRFNQKSPASNE